MAKENAVKFIELLKSDAELQAKLREATAAYEGPKDEKAVFEAVVAPLAEQAGLSFNYDEAIAAASAGRDLSDEELGAVAGGTGYCYVVGGSDEPDAWSCEDVIGALDAACAYVGITFA
ncbi:MAG: hypothetical protein K5859_01780 [Atopobiaceae bacterium]|nr:hypothetical protein [Atopobiaceae bacterium]